MCVCVSVHVCVCVRERVLECVCVACPIDGYFLSIPVLVGCGESILHSVQNQGP